ncbi:MAG: RecQ family ATP-dependent DNA helicase [Prevotella sp.]|nr:RecQ family ATP-dependent DNA helicase [Prevotella sp.]
MASYIEILKRYWGYEGFRGIQEDIIKSISTGHDTLGLMPTGGGKSITFQVPALACEGVCLVITPLIALMKDQVQNLKRRGIRAAAIHSGMSRDEIIQTLENAIFGAVKLLYVSPERLSTDIFIHKVHHMQVSFICVDEAHCISQWGYDFRPSYLAIADIRKELPGVPVLALTATATPLVVDDIQERLAFKEKRVFRMSFERTNLAYIVLHVTDKAQQILHLLNNHQGSVIIYTRSRRRTKEISDMLNAAGFSATFFHAGLDNPVKDQRQKDWQSNKIRIMVATNAFGMGIDKPDVRFVIHADCPESIEAYFQEAGRAGRDGEKAHAILLFSHVDQAKLLKLIQDTYPSKDEIRQVYDHLAYFFQIAVGSGYNTVHEFPIEKFCKSFRHFPTRVLSALKILQRAGYLEYNEEEDGRARIRFILERDELYRLHDNNPTEDALIVTLLRNYSGLFNDYRYIDEAFLAEQTGQTRPQVYLTLKELHRKRIVDFIPQKSTPFIRYTQRREESEHLILPPAVYDNLKERYTERIHKMIAYATSNNKCRSRMLLHYFGEESNRSCGLCDVCMEEERTENGHADIEQASQMILELLADEKPHHISILHSLPIPYSLIDASLAQLVGEEIIADDDGMISIN